MGSFVNGLAVIRSLVEHGHYQDAFEAIHSLKVTHPGPGIEKSPDYIELKKYIKALCDFLELAKDRKELKNKEDFDKLITKAVVLAAKARL
jgi:hypothetical protein